jgi:hypothetical protein
VCSKSNSYLKICENFKPFFHQQLRWSHSGWFIGPTELKRRLLRLLLLLQQSQIRPILDSV